MITQRAASRGATAIAQAAIFMLSRIFPLDRDLRLVEIDHN
jgi:hypothetical protein